MLDRPDPSIATSVAAAAPLLMLPGTLCDSRLFGPVLARLGSMAIVPPLAGADTAAELARVILAVAPKTVSLCGFSLGAIVALEIIAQAPHRVERLALIGCNPGRLDGSAWTARATLTKADFLRGESSPLLWDMAEATSEHAYRQQTAVTLSRKDSRARLRNIAVSTLVLCGAGDAICPPDLSREIAAAIPRARLAIIPGAGHYVPLDAPDVVAAELSAWQATPSRSYD